MEHNTPLRELENFIVDKDHPCLMAQTVFKSNNIRMHTYDNFGSKESATEIVKDIKDFLAAYDFESKDFHSFIATFPVEDTQLTELEFETLLWQQLNAIRQADAESDWDSGVSSDTDSPEFSFSIAGKAFYIVGLHPGSSRMARQAPMPTIVFNLHWQFEKLREMGAYDTVRDKIRERDLELQGSINPMLDDFGNSSETRQYSGREVGQEWKCPFHK